MTEARFIRRRRFRASHYYRRAEWSERRNREVFGAQSEPHEHEWTLEVRVVGPVDPETGFAVDLGVIDALLSDTLARWDGGDLNRLVPTVTVPTSEALAKAIFDSMVHRVPPPARLECVALFESPDLGAEYPVGRSHHD